MLAESEIMLRIKTSAVGVAEVCPMSIAQDCPRLPTPDEKFPDLEDLSVGAFIKGTGALPTFGRESIIKSNFGKS